MRTAVLGAIAVAAVIGGAAALVLTLPGHRQVGQAQPGEAIGFGYERRLFTTARYCADCHYGMEELWHQDEVLSDDGRSVEMRFANAYNVTELFAIELFGPGPGNVSVEPARERVTRLRVGETATLEVEVGPEASGLWVRTDAQVPEPSLQRSVWGRWQYDLSLAVTAADGTTLDADAGDGRDLKVLAMNASRIADRGGAGTWQVAVTLEDGQRPVADVVVRTHVSTADRFLDRVTFERPRGASLPYEAGANYTVRLRPYHDHTMLESYDWDPFDTSPVVVALTPGRPEPAPDPDPAEIWGDRRAVTVLERRFTSARVWYGTPTHDDPGVGSSYPYFAETGDPVPPGTSWVRFGLNWSHPQINPSPGIRFSPSGTASFLEPVLVADEPGHRRFEVRVPDRSWWDDPDANASDWDVAPYLPERQGEVNRFAGEIDLTVTALRSLGAGPGPESQR